MDQKKHTPQYTAEFRERGVRLYREQRPDYASDNAAYRAIASKRSVRFISPPRMRMRSPRTVQQMQPLFISNTSSSAFTTRSLSIPDSPNSLTMTAYFFPCRSVRMRFRSVVLPAPRKPVNTVTGIYSVMARSFVVTTTTPVRALSRCGASCRDRRMQGHPGRRARQDRGCRR